MGVSYESGYIYLGNTISDRKSKNCIVTKIPD